MKQRRTLLKERVEPPSTSIAARPPAPRTADRIHHAVRFSDMFALPTVLYNGRMGETYASARLIALLRSAAPLASCSTAAAPATVPSEQAFAPTATRPLSKVAPDEGCGGTGGVKVRPCPVILTKRKDTVVVAVSGPKVDDSAFVETGCEKRNVCTIGQFTSNSLKWFVYAATKCGSAVIYAYGYAVSQEVGIGHLKVINEDC